MSTTTLFRHEPEIVAWQRGNSLRLAISPNRTPFDVGLWIFWSILIIFTTKASPFIAIVLALYLANDIQWRIIGFETVSVDDGAIVFKVEDIFPRKQRGFQLTPESFVLRRKDDWRFRGDTRALTFCCAGRPIHFGQGLRPEQIVETERLLNEAILRQRPSSVAP